MSMLTSWRHCARNPALARRAMRNHLTVVIKSLLKAPEVQELELARARMAAQRKRYIAAS